MAVKTIFCAPPFLIEHFPQCWQHKLDRLDMNETLFCLHWPTDKEKVNVFCVIRLWINQYYSIVDFVQKLPFPVLLNKKTTISLEKYDQKTTYFRWKRRPKYDHLSWKIRPNWLERRPKDDRSKMYRFGRNITHNFNWGALIYSLF